MLIYLNYLMEMVLSSCEHANIMKWVRLLSNRKVVLIIVSSSGAISIPGLVFSPVCVCRALSPVQIQSSLCNTLGFRLILIARS